jgi:hypothetical protein
MTGVGGGVEFNWDSENTQHLKRHRVTPAEFEEIISGDPVYLEYQTRTDEERYKVLGRDEGRSRAHWHLDAQGGKVRAVTAYAAGRVYRDLYWETHE